MDERLHLDQERPRPGHRRQDRRARRVACGAARAGPCDGSGTGSSPLSRISNIASSPVGPNRFLVARRIRYSRLPLALEGEHRVDQVLERLRPGDRPLLGDVPDQEERRARALGLLHQPVGAVPHLPDRARRRLELVAAQRLDRVDQHRRRRRLRERREQRLEPVLAGDQDGGAAGAEPLGPQPELARRLLGAGVDHLPSPRREPLRELQQKGRLADPRLAGQEHRAARHDAAAEHAVELRQPRRRPRHLLLLHLRQRYERRGRRRSAGRRRRGPALAAPRRSSTSSRTPGSAPATSSTGSRRPGRRRACASPA